MGAFRDQIRLAFNPDFKKQTTAGTALANGLMTATMTATAVTPQREVRMKRFYNCDNQTLRRMEATSRLMRMTIQFDASAHLAAGFLAGAMDDTADRGHPSLDRRLRGLSAGVDARAHIPHVHLGPRRRDRRGVEIFRRGI